MRFAFAFALGAALVSGCAGGNVVECHGVNWYQIGKRDASFDGKDESKVIGDSCGAAFDAAQYRQGFDAGMQQRKK